MQGLLFSNELILHRPSADPQISNRFLIFDQLIMSNHLAHRVPLASYYEERSYGRRLIKAMNKDPRPLFIRPRLTKRVTKKQITCGCFQCNNRMDQRNLQH